MCVQVRDVRLYFDVAGMGFVPAGARDRAAEEILPGTAHGPRNKSAEALAIVSDFIASPIP
jgi:hypothetical protein